MVKMNSKIHKDLGSNERKNLDTSLPASLPPLKVSAMRRMMNREDSTFLHMVPDAPIEYAEDALIGVEDEDDSLFHVDGKFV